MYYLIRKSREEEGAIALMVLVFMMTAGVATILTLWSIGSITGAYNKLYIANQAAAYSAATTAGRSVYGDYQQLVFNCNGVQGDGTTCGPGDRTFDVANDVFGKTLTNSSGYGGFGLRYDSNNIYAGSNTANLFTALNRSRITREGGLEIYEIASTPEQAKIRCNNINAGAGDTYKEYNGALTCWRIIEGGIEFPWQYTTGVLTQAEATVPKIPGLCSASSSFCQVNLKVKAAASLNQTSAPSDFNSYLVNP